MSITISCSSSASTDVGISADSLVYTLSEDEESFVADSKRILEEGTNLVLYEEKIANLDARSMETKSVSYFENLFLDFSIKVTENEVYNEMGKNSSYFATQGSAQLFVIQMNSERKDEIKKISIQYSGIVDQYGVRNRMTYNQVMTLRPDMKIYVDKISENPILIAQASNIYYEFCCPLTKKRNYTPEDLKGLKIQNIVWQDEFTR